jgi:8-oxo-dGTP diphosphatase
VREVYEELGIRPPIGKLLAVDWAPHPDEGDKVLFIFDGGALDNATLAQIRFRDGELDKYAFAAAEQLAELTVERLARRLEESLAARRVGASAYLENGRVSDGRDPCDPCDPPTDPLQISAS